MDDGRSSGGQSTSTDSDLDRHLDELLFGPQAKTPSTSASTPQSSNNDRVRPSATGPDTDYSPAKKSLASYLEAHIRVAFDAINRKAFDTEPEAFQWMSPTYRVVQETGFRGSTHSKLETLDNFRKLTTNYPDYRLSIRKMETQIADSLVQANVFASTEVTGGPGLSEGHSRKFVSLFEWVFVEAEGRWYCIGDTTLSGMGEE